MLEITVKEVLKQAEIRKNTPRPLPVIEIEEDDSPPPKKLPKVTIELIDPEDDLQPVRVHVTKKDSLISELWQKMSDINVERGKLSTGIARMVEDGATQAQLRHRYNEIESFRPAMQDTYRLIKHVEKYGEMPNAPMRQEHVPNTRLLELKETKRSLENRRSKLKVKLKPSAKGGNEARRSQWEQDLALLDAEYEEVKREIDQIHDDARNTSVAYGD